MSGSSLERIGLLALVAVATGLQVRSCEQGKAFEDRIRSANAVADTFKARYDDLSHTYEDRLLTLFDATEVMALMRKQNRGLADRLEDLDAELVSITTAVAGLEESFEGTAPTTPTATGWSLAILDRHEYGESWLEIQGTAAVDTFGTGSYDLTLAGSLGITTSISQLPDDQLRVDLFSEVPSLRVYDISGAHRLEGLGDRGGGGGWWKAALGAVGGFFLGRL
jgi:hypothetical protein